MSRAAARAYEADVHSACKVVAAFTVLVVVYVPVTHLTVSQLVLFSHKKKSTQPGKRPNISPPNRRSRYRVEQLDYILNQTFEKINK